MDFDDYLKLGGNPVATKLTKEDKLWLKSLPHTAYMSHSGFKNLVMNRLGIPNDQFCRWITPYPWLEARDKEVRRRFK